MASAAGLAETAACDCASPSVVSGLLKNQSAPASTASAAHQAAILTHRCGAFPLRAPRQRIAFVGHSPAHAPQWMHSWSPTRRTSIGHLRTQSPQFVQRSGSTFTPSSAMRQKNP